MSARPRSHSDAESLPSHSHSSAVLPRWIPDEEVSNCMVCQKAFNTFGRRKHHCRNCGCVCCHECSKRKFVLPFSSSQSEVRVCDQCYPRLVENHYRTPPLAHMQSTRQLLPSQPQPVNIPNNGKTAQKSSRSGKQHAVASSLPDPSVVHSQLAHASAAFLRLQPKAEIQFQSAPDWAYIFSLLPFSSAVNQNSNEKSKFSPFDSPPIPIGRLSVHLDRGRHFPALDSFVRLSIGEYDGAGELDSSVAHHTETDQEALKDSSASHFPDYSAFCVESADSQCDSRVFYSTAAKTASHSPSWAFSREFPLTVGENALKVSIFHSGRSGEEEELGFVWIPLKLLRFSGQKWSKWLRLHINPKIQPKFKVILADPNGTPKKTQGQSKLFEPEVHVSLQFHYSAIGRSMAESHHSKLTTKAEAAEVAARAPLASALEDSIHPQPGSASSRSLSMLYPLERWVSEVNSLYLLCSPIADLVSSIIALSRSAPFTLFLVALFFLTLFPCVHPLLYISPAVSSLFSSSFIFFAVELYLLRLFIWGRIIHRQEMKHASAAQSNAANDKQSAQTEGVSTTDPQSTSHQASSFVPPSPEDAAPLSHTLAVFLSTVLLLEGQIGLSQARSGSFARQLFHGISSIRHAIEVITGLFYWQNPYLSGAVFSALMLSVASQTMDIIQQ